MSALPLSLLNLFITISFINGINTMAKNIPGFANGGILWFTDLSTLDSFYIFPLVSGLTFWYTSKVPTISLTKIISRMNEVPFFCIFFIVVQAANKYEPAVYFYLIPYKISLYTLSMMCRSKPIAKLSKSLGVPVNASAQQRIMERVITVMREFIDVVKKKKDMK
ncbi:hypothetical protein N665_0129s0003 [Sinapis alba]|nr:hypothetical protein N665_0129s0003 [Sinapis alba]